MSRRGIQLLHFLPLFHSLNEGGRADVVVNNRSPRGHETNPLATLTLASNESFCQNGVGIIHMHQHTSSAADHRLCQSSLFPMPPQPPQPLHAHVPRESVLPAKCHESPAASSSSVVCCCCFVPIDVFHGVPHVDLG